MCKRCIESDTQREGRSDSKQRRDSLRSVSSSTIDIYCITKSPAKILPYDVSNLITRQYVYIIYSYETEC